MEKKLFNFLLILVLLLYGCETQEIVVSKIFESWKVINITHYKDKDIITVIKIETNKKYKNILVKSSNIKIGDTITIN